MRNTAIRRGAFADVNDPASQYAQNQKKFKRALKIMRDSFCCIRIMGVFGIAIGVLMLLLHSYLIGVCVVSLHAMLILYVQMTLDHVFMFYE